MKKKSDKERILILGASGFIGNALYKELCGYFRTFGTYNTTSKSFENNRHFFQYSMEKDDVFDILQKVKPTIIISALRGDFASQVVVHQHISEYLLRFDSKLIFLSSANVFDAYSKYPSYEFDKTLSHSVYGHFKIKIENMLLRLPKKHIVIVRLPMVFGVSSPRVNELKLFLKEQLPIEIFPNLVMNVTSDYQLVQQIHYMINRRKRGIFHLGSTDLVHHDEFISDMITSLGQYKPKFKHVYTTNDARYLAVLPKENTLPKHLQIKSSAVLKELTV
jgi:dTDP-4-dehydrorhamnose reductase